MPNTILNYIKLELTNIPEELKAEKVTYNISKAYDNADTYKVYKKISLKDLDILVGEYDRTTDIKERYQKSIPISEYLQNNQEAFSHLIENASIDKIKEIENMQENYQDRIPYFVRYEKNYIWQIYYSFETDKYFTLFPLKEGDIEALLYLIKKKIEDSNTYIYVPICKEEISETLLDNKKITDMENYIWMFTKEWPNIFEVYEKDEPQLYIIGKTTVQEGLESKYRIVIKTLDEAEDRYNIFKALFILSTETKGFYVFEPYITEKGELSLTYNDEEISLNNIQKFVTEETVKQQALKYNYKKEIEDNTEKLHKLREVVKKQSDIYSKQQKQIVTFMDCRKSFFKKVKFYFKNNKKFSLYSKNAIKMVNDELKDVEVPVQVTNDANLKMKDSPDLFTISDLVITTQDVKKLLTEKKNLSSDLEATKLKQVNLNHKIENAQKYLDEIEEHKKSLLEFWKFTNKDNEKGLAEGKEEEEERSVKKVFNLQEDLKELGIKADEIQRKKLSLDECDAIYVAKYLLPSINSAITKSDTYVIDEEYEKLKEAYAPQNKYESLFGRMPDDQTDLKILEGKKHREIHKDLYQVLKFNNTTPADNFKDKIKEIGRLVNESYQKITSVYEMPIYYGARNKGFIFGTLNPYTLLEKENIDKIYKINANLNTHVIYLSNIIFYDNTNQTLPLGMDEGYDVILKVGEYKKINEIKINIVKEEDEFNISIKKMKVIEEGIPNKIK